MANFIGGLILGALSGGFTSFILMALLVASSESDKMEKCKHCGKNPTIADVGGNNPYYEVSCCDQVVGSHDKESAIGGWDMMQKGEINNGEDKQ